MVDKEIENEVRKNITDHLDRFLRVPELIKRVGLSKSQIYNLASKGNFPQPIKLGERASGWLESEVQQWISQRIADTRGELH